MNSKKLFIWGFLFMSVIGTLLHFVYEWSGNNSIVRLFAPWNESTWEHMKLLFFPMLALVLFLFFKLPEQKKFRIVHVLLAVIIAGGIGNMIDRFRLDYVVDFISFVLINYPIFNVADIYVVVATIGLFILFLFVYKEKDLEFLNFKQNRYREMK